MKPKVIFLATDLSVRGGTARAMADLITGLSKDLNLTIIATEEHQSAFSYPDTVALAFLRAWSSPTLGV